MTQEAASLEQESEVVAAPVKPPLPDYENVEFTLGQLWARGTTPIAFIVDINKYAVIIQQRINIEGGDKVVFDFPGGQELLSIRAFRKLLAERVAIIVEPKTKAHEAEVVVAIHDYREALAQKLVFEPKTLPHSDEEYQDLIDHEIYTVEHRVIPPPKRYRDRRGLHWLKAGLSGGQPVIKLWDPQAGRYVLPDGLPDNTSRIGFITGYLSFISFLSGDESEETFDELTGRITDVLKKNSFHFDEKSMVKKLKELEPTYTTPHNEDEITPMTHIRYKGLLPDKKDVPVKFPVYDIKIGWGELDEENVLQVFLFEEDKLVQVLLFTKIQNFEFIPTQVPTLLTQQ